MGRHAHQSLLQRVGSETELCIARARSDGNDLHSNPKSADWLGATLSLPRTREKEKTENIGGRASLCLCLSTSLPLFPSNPPPIYSRLHTGPDQKCSNAKAT